MLVAATFGQPGTALTILPNALQAGHKLLLALDRALGHSRALKRTRPESQPARVEPGGGGVGGQRGPAWVRRADDPCSAPARCGGRGAQSATMTHPAAGAAL